jgi:hypothetical protein
MKFALCVLFVLTLSGSAFADSNVSKEFGRLHFADATADACLASCSSQVASCKRVCPATFSRPCLSSCDSQTLTCRTGLSEQVTFISSLAAPMWQSTD